jgi:hypothetical protein
MDNILIGFEIELLTYQTVEDRKANGDTRDAQLTTFKRVLEELFSDSKYEFKIAKYGPTSYNKNIAYLVDDWSAGFLKSTANYFKAHGKKGIDSIYSVELLSPILPVSEALEFYKRVCENLFATGICHMNKSCGLHVNVSYKKRKDNINLNLLKVLTSFNIHKWRYAFQRENNLYCKTMPFNRRVLNEALSVKSGIEDVLNKDFVKKSDFKKFSAIGIHNWEFGRRKASRIEWRVAGSKKAMDFRLVSSMIKDVCRSMQNGLSKRKITKRDIKVNLIGQK